MNTRETASLSAARWRAHGEIVGLCSGAFDLFHPGHLRFIQAAEGRVNRLVVAITSDATVRRAKGAGRPLIPAAERLAMICALRHVSAAFIFHEHGDDDNLAAIRPDLFFRGRDHHVETMFEKLTLERLGIPVEILATPRWGTTELLEKLNSRNSKNPQTQKPWKC